MEEEEEEEAAAAEEEQVTRSHSCCQLHCPTFAAPSSHAAISLVCALARVRSHAQTALADAHVSPVRTLPS